MPNTSLSTRLYGGGIITTSGTSITLTDTSPSIQYIIMTAAGCTVTLPDATTLVAGTSYTFRASLGNSFYVVNHSGALLAPVVVYDVWIISLVDNSTVDGVWSISKQPMYNNVPVTNGSTLSAITNAVPFNGPRVNAPLNSTQSLVIENTTANALNVMVMDVSGSTIIVGPAAQIIGSGASSPSLAIINSTTAVCFYRYNNYLYGVVLTVSGTTVSVSAAQLLYNGGALSGYVAAAALTSTQLLVGFALGGSYVYTLLPVSLSGTTLTAGTALVSSTGTSSTAPYFLVTLNSTQAIFVYQSTGLNAYVATVSSNTVSVGSVTQLASTNYPSMTGLSSTQALCTYINTNNTFPMAVTLNVSGTTITLGTPLQISSAISSITTVSSFSSTQAVCSYRDGNVNIISTVLTVSGTSVSAGSLLSIPTASPINLAVSAINTTNAVCVYTLNSTMCAIRLSISGTTLSSVAQFSSAFLYPNRLQLSSTRSLLITGSSPNSGGSLSVVPIDASGATLIIGARIAVLNTSVSYLSSAVVNSTTVICTYRDASTHLYAVVFTISGSTVTVGTPVAINAAATTYTSVTVIDSTHAVCAYQSTGANVSAVVLTISGTTVSAGTPSVINDITAASISMVTMSSTRAVCVLSGTTYHEAITLDVSGTTISAGTLLTINNATINTFTLGNAIAISSSSVMFCTSSASASYYCILSIVGTTITNAAPASMGSASISNLSISGTQIMSAITPTAGPIVTRQYYTNSGLIGGYYGSLSLSGSSLTYVSAIAVSHAISVIIYVSSSSIYAQPIYMNVVI